MRLRSLIFAICAACGNGDGACLEPIWSGDIVARGCPVWGSGITTPTGETTLVFSACGSVQVGGSDVAPPAIVQLGPDGSITHLMPIENVPAGSLAEYTGVDAGGNVIVAWTLVPNYLTSMIIRYDATTFAETHRIDALDALMNIATSPNGATAFTIRANDNFATPTITLTRWSGGVSWTYPGGAQALGFTADDDVRAVMPTSTGSALYRLSSVDAHLVGDALPNVVAFTERDGRLLTEDLVGATQWSLTLRDPTGNIVWSRGRPFDALYGASVAIEQTPDGDVLYFGRRKPASDNPSSPTPPLSVVRLDRQTGDNKSEDTLCRIPDSNYRSGGGPIHLPDASGYIVFPELGAGCSDEAPCATVARHSLPGL